MMPPQLAEHHHYARAPIQEAVIEIRCSVPEDVTVDALASLGAQLDGYEEARPGFEVEQQVDFSGEQIVASAQGRTIGHLFRRRDGRRVIQARLDRLLYAWLHPYDRWESLEREALEAWSKYQSVAKPDRIVRLGVRYVNRIDVDSGSIEIKDYIRTSPDISPYLPQMLSGYFMQVVTPLDREGRTATITTTLVEPPNPDATSLLLDIDTYQDIDIDCGGEDVDTRLTEALDSLRRAKNYVFEACITDATRGLIR